MASIYLSNKLLNALKPTLFAKAATNEAVLIGGFSKFYIESRMLKMEFGTYAAVCGIPTMAVMHEKNDELAALTGMGILWTGAFAGMYLLSSVIAGVRVCTAIHRKNIHVLQLQ